MSFTNHLNEGLIIYREAKKQALTDIGNFIATEAMLRASAAGVNMTDSIESDVINEDEVDIGITKDFSEQQGQSFIEPAVMENADELGNIAAQSMKAYMDGDK